MPDLLKILRLPPICDGKCELFLQPVSASHAPAANTSGTVFFSAPLFRANLRYRVITKPSSAKAATEKIGQWIMDHHLSTCRERIRVQLTG